MNRPNCIVWMGGPERAPQAPLYVRGIPAEPGCPSIPRERFAELAPFPVTAPMRLGVIPMGSADGLRWLHAGRVLVRGHAAPIVGAPSLEHTRIDLTGVPDAGVGDEVVIIGRQGNLEISPAEVASRHGLGLHHVATTVGPRVARVYFSGGTIV